MERYFTFDNYNTYLDWHLILTDKDISLPTPKTYYVELEGVDGSLDLSEALSGHMAYSDRTISATFWTDYGTRSDRVAILRSIRNALHGRRVKIVEPDDTDHYMIGRVTVDKEENNVNYASLEIEAQCEPYRYSNEIITRTIKVTDSATIIVNNNGALTTIPTITVSATMTVGYGDKSVSLGKGTYTVSDLKLKPGATPISFTGKGTVTISYKEGDI